MQVITYANTRKSIKTLMCHFNFTKRHLSIWKFSAKQNTLKSVNNSQFMQLNESCTKMILKQALNIFWVKELAHLKYILIL